MFLFLIPLLALLAFAVQFRMDPRSVWPGILLTFGASTLAGMLLFVGVVAADQAVGGVWASSVGLVIALLVPLLTAAMLCISFVAMWRHRGMSWSTLLSGILGLLLTGYLVSIFVPFFSGNADTAITLLLVGLPIWMLTVGFVGFLGYSALYAWRAPRLVTDAKAVVVLGGWLRDGREVPPQLARRIDLGIKLAEQRLEVGHDVPLVLSGGLGPGAEVREAEAMREYAVRQGFGRSRILLEDQATNTYENMVFSKRMLLEKGIRGPVVVATSGYHAFRSATLMRKAGLDGHVVGDWTPRYYLLASIFREYLGLIRQHRWIVVSALLLSVPAIVGLLHAFDLP